MTTNARAVKEAVEKASVKQDILHKAGKNHTVECRHNGRGGPFAGMEYRFENHGYLVATFDVPTATWSFRHCGWPTITAADFIKDACAALDFDVDISFADQRFTVELLDRHCNGHEVSGDLGDTLMITECIW